MKIFNFIVIFLTVYFVYFAVGTEFSFKPKWALDYFNPLAQSLMNFRLDIPNPGTTYDLAFYKGKWYAPWGPLPALALIPFQLVTGRFIPTFYVSLLFASLNVSVLYLLLCRLKNDFLPKLSSSFIYLTIILFAFGSTHFYVGTLGSSWHVDQMVSSFLAMLGIYLVFKKQRSYRDYFLSAMVLSLSLIGRPTIVLIISLPLFLYFWEHIFKKQASYREIIVSLRRAMVLFGLPVIVFSVLFFLYNYARFENILEYGYNNINESTYLKAIRERSGTFSLSYIPYNLWYMLFEIPSINLGEKIRLNFNLLGNSIFFLTPPLLGVFLARINPYTISLWLAVVVTMLPSLMIYSTGWMQFGYRYSLDITVLLILLMIFGMKGKLNMLYILGILFAIFLHILGIQALQ